MCERARVCKHYNDIEIIKFQEIVPTKCLSDVSINLSYVYHLVSILKLYQFFSRFCFYNVEVSGDKWFGCVCLCAYACVCVCVCVVGIWISVQNNQTKNIFTYSTKKNYLTYKAIS